MSIVYPVYTFIYLSIIYVYLYCIYFMAVYFFIQHKIPFHMFIKALTLLYTFYVYMYIVIHTFHTVEIYVQSVIKIIWTYNSGCKLKVSPCTDHSMNPMCEPKLKYRNCGKSQFRFVQKGRAKTTNFMLKCHNENRSTPAR